MLALQPIDPTRAFGRRLRVSDLFAFPGLHGAQLVAGHDGLDHRLAGINVMQVPTDRYAKRDGLLLAAAPVFADASESTGLLERLAARDVAAVAIRGRSLTDLLPPEAIAMADRNALPLIELPETIHLDHLLTELLETLVANQFLELRASGEVRDRLTGYVLAGGGLDRLPDAIAEIVVGDVVVVDAAGHQLATSEGADVVGAAKVARAWAAYEGREPLQAGDDWIAWPVLAGVERLGALITRPPQGRESVVFAALEHGATNAALQILHEREALAADANLREGFFRDLLQGSLEAQAAERRARAIGFESGSYRVLLVTEPSLTARRISDLADGALVVEHAGAFLAVLPHPGGALEALQPALAGGHAGVSSPYDGLEALPAAVAEADEALAAARRFDRQVVLRHFEDLGPLRMLSRVPADELEAFHRDVLGPLDALAPELHATMLDTLDLLLVTGLNVAETARRGGWHYNTVRYRVARLTELLGPFIADGARLEALSLALLVRRELALTGDGGGNRG
jgi:purine catabolism regulator